MEDDDPSWYAGGGHDYGDWGADGDAYDGALDTSWPYDPKWEDPNYDRDGDQY